ncbi:hypothetical protein Tco_1057102 [Tanacetum coccineum]|uniref:Uncharacterized protein n=1 Tax=Tanacetum coccineum TaxID=301880 RepID=A0ABQ5H4F0_9ASTR
MQEPSESRTRVRVPPSQIDPKHKGKAKMVKPEKPKKEKDQIEYDADVAQRLKAELDEEARLERKRNAEEELDQESSKRQKTSESSELAEKPREIYTEGTRKYWKIIRVRNHTESLVKEKFNSTEPTDDKEREIWVELKRLFEPDTDDELWKLQKHIHDLTWRLYDSCGVHHVSTEKEPNIYMLVKKEYPLSRGTLTLMLVAKLLVDQDNEMSRELLRKIFMQAERPRR